MRLSLGAAMAVAGLILLVGCLLIAYPRPPLAQRHCTILVEPNTFRCSDGHVYLVHQDHWQDLGRTAPVPVPKA